jgi:hypothetical protein
MPVTLELVYLEMKIASPFRLQYNEVDWSFEKDLAINWGIVPISTMYFHAMTPPALPNLFQSFSQPHYIEV